MSRIHEALQKAKQEQAAAQANGGIMLALDSTPFAPDNATVVDAAGATQSANSVLTSGNPHLRFEELTRHCAHSNWRLDSDINAFLDSGEGAGAAEQFRTLRSRLYQLRASSDRPLRTILITSAIAGEGKTFVASNLAQAFARQPDCRVLLIDADLRQPRLHQALGAPITPGLSDYLRGDGSELAIIQYGQIGSLCFVAGGSEARDASELLSNRRLKAFLERVTPLFDWVIVDAPPSLPVADSEIVANHCDGVVLVLRAAVTPSETAQRACQNLRERNLVGVVLNGAKQLAGYSKGHDYHAKAEGDGAHQ